MVRLLVYAMYSFSRYLFTKAPSSLKFSLSIGSRFLPSIVGILVYSTTSLKLTVPGLYSDLKIAFISSQGAFISSKFYSNFSIFCCNSTSSRGWLAIFTFSLVSASLYLYWGRPKCMFSSQSVDPPPLTSMFYSFSTQEKSADSYVSSLLRL